MFTGRKVGVRTNNNLLNIYTNATAAYSLRKLKSDYLGSVIRIRRSSDNTELNIRFDSNGVLDIASISAFCSNSWGYITTWYDQSGNSNDMIQEIASCQPIIWNGSIILRGNKPSILNTSGSQFFKLNNPINLGKNHTFFAVIDFESTGKEYIGDYGTGHSSSWAFLQTSGEYGSQRSYSNSGVQLSTDRSLFTLTRVTQYGQSQSLVRNFQNSLQSGVSFNVYNDFWFSNLSGEDQSYGFVGYQQECIIYSFDMSNVRSLVENNINSYYSIY